MVKYIKSNRGGLVNRNVFDQLVANDYKKYRDAGYCRVWSDRISLGDTDRLLQYYINKDCAENGVSAAILRLYAAGFNISDVTKAFGFTEEQIEEAFDTLPDEAFQF